MTQVEAILYAIRRNPGITRSDIHKLKVDGYSIANPTARITEARKKLKSLGQQIICTKKYVKKWKTLHTHTTYHIESI